MSAGAGRVGLAVVCGLVLLAAVLVDVPAASDGRFWSDSATYYAMAQSLASDGDVEFGPQDLARVRVSYPGGPQGVFLKRVRDAAGARLVYAKSLVFPAVAAPFARVLGADRGLLVLNALLLVASLVCGWALLAPVNGPGPAALGVAAILLASVAPAYVFWQTPEVLNLALATFALLAWKRGRPLLAAVLLGLAAYSKPTQAALAIPLLLEPLVCGHAGGMPRRADLGACARRAAVLLLVFGAGFAANRLATGEFNYQGGERKTFYDRYPFDPGVSFDSPSGVWMTTDHVGPLVAGRDDAVANDRVAAPRPASELRQSLAWNLLYFWIGRFGGVLPYFPGFALALAAFLVAGPRGRDGWLALVALAVSWLGYVDIIPDNWYGGSGTIGNRYFLGVLPLGLLLIPRGRARAVAILAGLLALPLTLPILLSPVQHGLRPGMQTLRGVLPVLPAELTMLSDLGVFTEVWRKHRPYYTAGGDVGGRPREQPPSYFLWFLDDGTYGQESSFGEEGFWLRAGSGAEVVLQTLAPPTRVRLRVTAGPGGDIVTAWLAGERQRIVLRPLTTGTIELTPRGGSLGYYGTQLHRLRLQSRYGGATDKDARRLGSFVRVVIEGSRPQDGAGSARHPAPCAAAPRVRG